MFIRSPNMNLPIATVGNEPGPNYAFDVNNSFTLVDSHNHTPGQGVPITPAGMNINAPLTFQNNTALALSGAVFTAQVAAVSTLQSISVSPGSESPTPIQDLWYTDSAGNKIQITAGGQLNAAAAAIPGESFSTGTFFWKQGAGSTIPANFDIGSITLRPNVALTTFGVILGPPSTISSQYNINLPLQPASTSFLTMDSSGNMAASVPIANGITASNISASAGLNPAGTVLMFAGASVPTGYLRCDGSAVSRTGQAALFAAIGTTYGVGNGSTTFNIPNTQGVFVRDNGSQSISGTTYTGSFLGAKNTDTFMAHNHQLFDDGGSALGRNGGGSPSAVTFQNLGSSSTSTLLRASTLEDAGSGAPRSGAQTQPASITFNYIIKT